MSTVGKLITSLNVIKAKLESMISGGELTYMQAAICNEMKSTVEEFETGLRGCSEKEAKETYLTIVYIIRVSVALYDLKALLEIQEIQDIYNKNDPDGRAARTIISVLENMTPVARELFNCIVPKDVAGCVEQIPIAVPFISQLSLIIEAKNFSKIKYVMDTLFAKSGLLERVSALSIMATNKNI